VTPGQLAIIADDLSSCTDCGIQIARDGLQTYVLLDRRQDAGTLAAYDVVAVDTDSRAAPSTVAYRRTAEAARFVQQTARAFFKSLDSTLRGNLGAEVDAVMDVIRFDLAAVAPAYPFYGRTTIGGIHFLHGQRIDETEFASDPQSPVKEADLVRLFASQSRRNVGLVGLDAVRNGSAAVGERVKGLHGNGAELVILDAQSEDDLDVIVSGVAASGLRVLWVGSTGLAGHISKTLESPVGTLSTAQAGGHAGAPILCVVGSASQVTRDQVTALLREAAVSLVRMDPIQIIEAVTSQGRETDRCGRQAVAELRAGRDVVLDVVSSRDAIAAAHALGRQNDMDGSQVGAVIVASLAEVTASIVELVQVGGLVLTGGDTARAVCDRLGAEGILILREVEPGIPLARMVGAHELPIVTKAGAFGTADALVRAGQMLKGDG
jgi:D-threonate/D-erythronate kinase